MIVGRIEQPLLVAHGDAWSIALGRGVQLDEGYGAILLEGGSSTPIVLVIALG